MKKYRLIHIPTGEFINTLCNTCNLKYQYKKFLPVYIHNLKGYDGHFIVNALNTYGYKEYNVISCIPSTEEKYISFSKKIKVDTYVYKGKKIDVYFEIRFVDTLAFLPASISTLTDNLKKDCTTTKQLRKVFKNVSKQFTSDEKFKLMISKGAYPYEYVDNYNKLYDAQLPPQKAFYSSLNNSSCSDDDYKRALNVWTIFECKTLLDYHNLYLATDVLLLADIWSNFRKVCLKIYNLDVSYYYTSPGLSWDAFLKLTDEYYMKTYGIHFEIELLTDMDMFLFVESSIRGGLSQISKRYAKANNKYMSTYDKSLMDSYILYLDANNLYGYAMCE